MKYFYFSQRKKLFLSLFFGLLAAVLMYVYLQDQEMKIRNHYQMSTVLRAKKYLGEGKLVSFDSVEEVQMPDAYIPPTAISAKTQLKNDQGDLFLYPRIGILKGEILTKSKLYEAASWRGLAWTLAPGQTAFSLRLGVEDAVAGFVQPGDWVHIFCTLNKTEAWPKDQTTLILKKVRVVGVNDSFWDPTSFSTAGKERKEKTTDSVLVTLSLTSMEAARVALATQKGRVHLALTSPMDQEDPPDVGAELINLKTAL
jgi:pilus assembly protein CpaB